MAADHSLLSGRFLAVISVRGLDNPRAIVQLEELGELKNPIRVATFLLVA
jgi:hypothetical protein